MAIIGFARVGDRTTHGGTILTGDNTLLIEGKAAARRGDTATCPLCKRVSTIVTSRFPQSNSFGTGLAFDGDYLDCGARIMSSLNGKDGHDDGQGAGSEAQAAESASGAAAAPTAPNYQEFFVLQNQDGQPLANQNFDMTASSGEALGGVSDGSGRTEVIWTQAPADVSINVSPDAGATDDPYHYTDQ